MNLDEKVTYFAETDFRNKKTKFGIKNKDRSRHMYVIGMTGMGKSTMLENLAIQDILSGEGVAFIDPHGGTAEKLLSYIPEHRMKDVVYFAPFDDDYPISFNVLEDVDPKRRHLVVDGLMSSFKKIFVDSDGKGTFSARMEYILQNILQALLEYPNSTLLGVNRMLSDKDYRKKVVDNITDPSVKAFWVEEYAKYTDKFAAEAAPAIQNKVGQFTGNPSIRNLVGQPKSSFDIREIMDNRKILIMNLSKGRMGEGNSNLIGSMLITKMYLAAMSRADKTEGEMRELPPFNFYVDEFQSFASDSFANILSEARKYKLNLTIAHQYVDQMSEKVKEAVFGNVGTMVVFRVGSADAEIFEKEFAPHFLLEDVVSLGQRQIYLRLMIDGVGSQPFSATTLPPIPMPEVSYKQQVIDFSRMKFARKKEDVEKEIREWHAPVTFTPEDRARDFQKGEQSKMNKGIPERKTFQSQATYFPKASQGGSQQTEARTSQIVTVSHNQQIQPVKPYESNVHTQQRSPISEVKPTPQPVQQFSRPPQPAQVVSKPEAHTSNTSLRDVLQKEIKVDVDNLEPKAIPQKSVQPQIADNGRVSLSSLLGSQKQAQTHFVDAKQRSDFKAHVNHGTQTPRTSPQQPFYPQKETVQKEEYIIKTESVKKDDNVVVKKSNEIPADVLKKLLE